MEQVSDMNIVVLIIINVVHHMYNVCHAGMTPDKTSTTTHSAQQLLTEHRSAAYVRQHVTVTPLNSIFNWKYSHQSYLW